MVSPSLWVELESVLFAYIDEIIDEGFEVLSRNDLLNASLTCRAWASRLRPRIFERVRVCSQKDALTLLSFITSSHSLLPQCIQDLSLCDSSAADEANPPWFHLILSSRAAFTYLRKLFYTIERPHSKNSYPLITRIPASPPRSATRCDYAYLHNLILQSFDELLQFSATVGGYGTLNCRKVSWQDQNNIEQGHRPASLSSPDRAIPQEIFIHNSKVRWPFIWLLVTTTPRLPHLLWKKNCVRFVQPSQLGHLESLLRCVLETCGPRCQSHKIEIDDTEDDSSLTRIRMRCECSRTSPTVEVSISSATGLVTNITVDYEHRDLTKDECSLLIDISDPTPFQYHWDALDKCAHAFGETLERVSVRVRTDEGTLRTLSGMVLPRMPEMQQAGRLAFYYAEPMPGYAWEDDVIIDLWKFEWRPLNL